MLVLAKPKTLLQKKKKEEEEEPIFVHLKLILLCTHVKLNTFSLSVRILVLVDVLCSKFRPHNAMQ